MRGQGRPSQPAQRTSKPRAAASLGSPVSLGADDLVTKTHRDTQTHTHTETHLLRTLVVKEEP